MFTRFFQQHPEKYEQKGDEYFSNALWGRAKLEYEKAMDQLEKGSDFDDSIGERIQSKLRLSEEALAREHCETAGELMEQEYFDEALEWLHLAENLTRDPELIHIIESRIREIGQKKETPMDMEWLESMSPDVLENVEEVKEAETFGALCSTLPKEVRAEYLTYGEAFKSGYMALNNGAFDVASEHLSKAMEEHPDPDSYIPLELATAYLNLEKYDEAQSLLDTFLKHHPEALPGYAILCEVLWETNAFDQAEALLAECPEDVKDSVAYFMLKGETLIRAGRISEAVSFYQGILDEYGWQEPIGRALARALETKGDPEGALEIYTQIMNQCISCHSRIDPRIKRKVADLSFQLGRISVPVLELYLSLVREDPGQADSYYQKISQIYSDMGNDEEARRFGAFAQQARGKKG